MLNVIINTDGASRGNPGEASIAYVIQGLSENPIEHGKKIGQTTNNQAEYRASVSALEKTVSLLESPAHIVCYSDSELMVKQLLGEYRVKDNLLRPHYNRILELVQVIKQQGGFVEFQAIRREQNRRADQLANNALDDKLS
jgi:ribonuclease HI